MRVLVSGSDHAKINVVAIKTFLDGLYVSYKDDLHIIYTGSGHVSKIVEDWVKKTWPSSTRNSFNMEWLIKHWSDEYEGIGYAMIEESKPDLLFLFGYDSYETKRAANYNDIPAFIVEKI